MLPKIVAFYTMHPSDLSVDLFSELSTLMDTVNLLSDRESLEPFVKAYSAHYF